MEFDNVLVFVLKFNQFVLLFQETSQKAEDLDDRGDISSEERASLDRYEEKSK